MSPGECKTPDDATQRHHSQADKVDQSWTKVQSVLHSVGFNSALSECVDARIGALAVLNHSVLREAQAEVNPNRNPLLSHGKVSKKQGETK